MSLDSAGIRNRIASHALADGSFERVLRHEPVSAPGSGLTYAVWVADLGPVPPGSGLSETTARLELNGRVFLPADTEPMDDVDDAVTNTVDALIGAYSGGFKLGDTVRCIDLLGMYGTALRARYGYLTLGSTTYRIATLTIPIIVNAVWGQVA